ncbi:uncharacterized protein LOC135201308 [Macrobrachium nipponense]|uniref:uncharacterized protein LOC135201308 n=1 Tax=Macrobrachium nipponense TaxID=159736 RepID=UPI0030C832CF
MTASSGSSSGDSREERLFAIHTTTSVTKLTTVTVTGLSTCLSTATGSCLGRKRRMAMPSALNLEVLLGDSEADLAGSRTDSFEAAQPLFAGDTEEGGNRRKQRELTVWSTAYTTITITSTSILASTTVTASALCLVSGISQTCFS